MGTSVHAYAAPGWNADQIPLFWSQMIMRKEEPNQAPAANSAMTLFSRANRHFRGVAEVRR
jgi:hypothetical protein